MSEPKRVYYGGQAVIEGVMIRGPKSFAVACRNPEGEIVSRSQPLSGAYTGVVRRIPFIRGVIVLWETLALGIRALTFSSNVALGEDTEEPSGPAMWLVAAFSLSIAAVIFFAGPFFLADWLDDQIGSHLVVILIEGVIRLGVVVAYVGGIGLIPDIRRVYMYHGAEHKTIHAMEHGDPLEPVHIQKYSPAHVRCGTSFLLTIVVVSIVVFAAVGDTDFWLRLVSRIVLIPVIASIAYEAIRLGGAFENNPITKTLMWPNLALQALTTRQPTDDQVEVAVRALTEVLDAEGFDPASLATSAPGPREPEAAPGAG